MDELAVGARDGDGEGGAASHAEGLGDLGVDMEVEGGSWSAEVFLADFQSGVDQRWMGWWVGGGGDLDA